MKGRSISRECTIKQAALDQLVEQRICNQPGVGSSPIGGSVTYMGRYQSGQMGRTVNPLLRLRRFESCSPHQIKVSLYYFDGVSISI